MKILKKFILSSCLFCYALYADVCYEGTVTFSNYGVVDFSWMQQLLPYNPVIIDIGAYFGANTCKASKIWPKGKIYAFEPNPRAFHFLENTIAELNLTNIHTYNMALNDYNGLATLYLEHGPRNDDVSYEHESSLLPLLRYKSTSYKGESIEVPCVTLEDWCRENGVDHVDVLRIETEGLELPILRSSPHILSTAKVIIVQSFFNIYRNGMTFYFDLKDCLTKAGFVPLAHWYNRGQRGLAVYVSNELFDAYFVRSLGLGSGGIAYP